MRPPIEQASAQGYDLQIGTVRTHLQLSLHLSSHKLQNVLGHWYLITLLLPALTTAALEGTGAARVVTLSSSASDFAPTVNWDVLADDLDARTKFGPMNLYMQSKMLNVVAALELARRHGESGVVFSSLNPGMSLLRHRKFSD